MSEKMPNPKHESPEIDLSPERREDQPKPTPESVEAQKELQRAKDYLVGATVLGLEDTQSIASFYGMKYLLTKNIETPQEVLDRIKAVTLKEVQELADFLLKDATLYFAMIGPFKQSDKQRFLEILK